MCFSERLPFVIQALCFRLKHLPCCEGGISTGDKSWHPQAWSGRGNPLPQADTSIALSWHPSHWNLRSLNSHMEPVVFPKASLHHKIEINFIRDRKHSSGTNSTFLTELRYWIEWFSEFMLWNLICSPYLWRNILSDFLITRIETKNTSELPQRTITNSVS